MNGEYDDAFHTVAFDAAYTAMTEARPEMDNEERNRIAREIAENWRADFMGSVEGENGFLRRAYPEA